MSGGDNYYTIQRSAELLDIPTEKVRGLARKGKLKAHRDEETGRWLLEGSSVYGYLISSRVDRQGARSKGASNTITTTAVMPNTTQDSVHRHEAKGVKL